MSLFNEARRADLYREEFLAELPDADPFDFLGQAFARSRHRDEVTAASLADLVTYLPCDLMTKVDIASMANSLECRRRFSTIGWWSWRRGCRSAYKLRRGRGKRILREAFPELLPPRVMRRPKMGFGVPLEQWFRHELKDYSRQVLLDRRALDRGYFRPEAVDADVGRASNRGLRSRVSAVGAAVLRAVASRMDRQPAVVRHGAGVGHGLSASQSSQAAKPFSAARQSDRMEPLVIP